MHNDNKALPDTPVLTVVIPTKNRYSTLIPVVSALAAAIPDPGLQMVIEDNTEDNHEALAFLAALNDPRIVYTHRADPISIVENTEAALSRVTGEYVTFIGDDDLVSPFIVDVARQLRELDIEAVTYPPAYYWWPTVVFAKPSRYHSPGAFWFPRRFVTSMRELDSSAERAHVLNSGAVSIFDLPRLYHGVVRREVLDNLRSLTGSYVNGASPDMALAVGLSFHVKKHVVLDYPLTIYGASRNSGGGFTAANRHYGKIEDQPHLPRSTVENWSEKLPRVWSEFTIYPQTVGEVLTALGAKEKINYTAFYAAMAVSERHLRRLLAPLIASHLRSRPGEVLPFLKVAAKKTLGRLRRAANARLASMPYDLEHFDTVTECMAHLRARPTPLSLFSKGR